MARAIATLIVTVAAILLMAWQLAQFTVVPMMKNYRECGHVTLCNPIPDPSP